MAPNSNHPNIVQSEPKMLCTDNPPKKHREKKLRKVLVGDGQVKEMWI